MGIFLIHFILTTSQFSLPPQPQVCVSIFFSCYLHVFDSIKYSNSNTEEIAFELLDIWLCGTWIVDKPFPTGTKLCRGDKVSVPVLHMAISTVLCHSGKSFMLHFKIMIKNYTNYYFSCFSVFVFNNGFIFWEINIFYLSPPPAPPFLPIPAHLHILSLKNKYKTWSPVCVGWLLLSMGPVLGVVTMYSATQLKETDIISPSSFLLAINTWLEVEFMLISTSLYWDFDRLELEKVLCALTQSLWALKCTFSAVAGRHCFLTSSTLRIFPLPSLYRSLSLKQAMWQRHPIES